jgi:hypothetical protein
MLAHVRMLRGECQRDASRVRELAAASEALESLGEVEVNLQIALAACADLRAQIDALRPKRNIAEMVSGESIQLGDVTRGLK